jgi:hypothetical protein
MSGIFVNPEDEIKVRIVVATNKHGAIFAESDEDMLKEMYPIEDLDMTSLQTFEAVFRQPSFKDSVELSTEFSVNAAGDTSVDFNPVDARYRKMSKLLKTWTFKDDAGGAVPPTEENVAKLHPIVASVIATALDAQSPMV